VTQGGKSITAFVKGTGGFEVAIVKRGAQWKIGIASLGRVLEPGNVKRVLEPGNVKRTDGKSACAAM